MAMATMLALAACQSAPTHESRAQCELRELESVGYNPWNDDYYYPRQLQAAEARLRAQKQARGQADVDTCDDSARGVTR
jgi:hypothetical protein